MKGLMAAGMTDAVRIIQNIYIWYAAVYVGDVVMYYYLDC